MQQAQVLPDNQFARRINKAEVRPRFPSRQRYVLLFILVIDVHTEQRIRDDQFRLATHFVPLERAMDQMLGACLSG